MLPGQEILKRASPTQTGQSDCGIHLSERVERKLRIINCSAARRLDSVQRAIGSQSQSGGASTAASQDVPISGLDARTTTGAAAIDADVQWTNGPIRRSFEHGCELSGDAATSLSNGMTLNQDTTRDGNLYAIAADHVFDGRTWHRQSAVLIAQGRIRGIAAWGEISQNASQRRLPAGSLIAPGFIDLQVNGGDGVLLNDHPTVKAMQAIARAHARYGTTSCLPTLITDTRDRTIAAIAAARLIAGQNGVIGVHLEGPFISPARPGIHRPDRIVRAEPDDLEWLAELAQASRSLITLAPECVPEGFIRRLNAMGLRVSAGHSEASAETMLQAIEQGLTGVTHLFNAMPPLAGRAPGIVGTALAEPRLIAGLIADGVHVDPVSIRAAFAAKGSDGIALVSDAMPTVGGAIDHFTLMGREITLRNGWLTAENGTLAGAHLDMASAVRNAVKLAGIPLEDALRAASATPARFLGLEDELGSLKTGARADLVAMTPELAVIATWRAGVEIHTAD
jgi:N-acetylglucosamine-6-phosphate deacetylase